MLVIQEFINRVLRRETFDKPIEDMLDSKVIATTVTTALGGWAVAAAAKYGYDLDIALLVFLIGPPVFALVNFGVGYLKSDLRLKALIDFYRRSGQEPPEPDEALDEAAPVTER
jgi:hypothetical protein